MSPIPAGSPRDALAYRLGKTTGLGIRRHGRAILALAASLLMEDFAINLGTYRSGVQIASLVSIVGLILT